MMIPRSLSWMCVGALLLSVALVGCGRGPLLKLRTHKGCPWCSPTRQAQEGERSMGSSFYGDIWKNFWMDKDGDEHDPEAVGKEVWSYLKEIGYVSTIEDSIRQGRCSPAMRIVSVNPVIVVMQPCQHKRYEHLKVHLSHGIRHPFELTQIPDRDMYFDEPMQWFSPDLKTAPTEITFSKAGVAEITLPDGKLKLVHEGEWCKITRE